MLTAVLSILSAIWGSPWGRTIIIGIGIFMFGVTKGWGWARTGVDAKIQRAITSRDDYWRTKIAESNKAHERAMRDAIKSAETVRPADTPDELRSLCADPARGANCREKDSVGMQSP